MLSWSLCGITLVGLMIAGALLNWQEPDPTTAEPGLGLGTILSLIAGVIYCLSLLLGPRGPMRVWQIVLLLVVAAGIRAPMWCTPSVEGWDYWRYLCDGALTARGVNPYRYSPQELLDGQVADQRVAELAEQGQDALDKINHPHLRTIYPPVAQGLFALAYWLKPFSLTAWRVVLLGFDVLAAVVVLVLLRRLGLPSALVAVYLWNPLLVGEGYYGGHVDLVLAGLLGLFAWALLRRRAVLAALILALATGIKLWPMLLIFFVPQAAGKNYRRLLLALAIFVALSGVLALGYLGALGSQDDSGLITYAGTFQLRAGAYLILHKLAWNASWLLQINVEQGLIGRALLGLILIGSAAWLGLRQNDDGRTLCTGLATVGLLVFLLNPIPWPWYYLPVICLAAVSRARAGLLALTVLAPLCYLPAGTLPELTLVYMVHLPIWILLVGHWLAPSLSKLLNRRRGYV